MDHNHQAQPPNQLSTQQSSKNESFDSSDSDEVKKSNWILFELSGFPQDVLSSSWTPSDKQNKNELEKVGLQDLFNSEEEILTKEQDDQTIEDVSKSEERIKENKREGEIDADDADDDSLIELLVDTKKDQTPELRRENVSTPDLKLHFPNHNGAGLFQEALLTRSENSKLSLKDRINSWQEEQTKSVVEDKRRYSLASMATQNGLVESWGTESYPQLYSSLRTMPQSSAVSLVDEKEKASESRKKYTKLINNQNRKTSSNKRFYGDYLLKNLSDNEKSKLQRVLGETNHCIKNSDEKELSTAKKNSSNKKFYLGASSLIKPLLVSTLFINDKLYNSRPTNVEEMFLNNDRPNLNNSQAQMFWENDVQSVSSRLSVSSFSSEAWKQSESWADLA